LDRLDAQAAQVIRTLEEREASDREGSDARQRVRRQLLHGGGDGAEGTARRNGPNRPPSYPEWWIRPADAVAAANPAGSSTVPLGSSSSSSSSAAPAARALSDECDSIRRLLNEPEFGSALEAMTEQALLFSEQGRHGYADWTVDQAAVAAVGPRGVLLRAALRQPSPSDLFFSSSSNRLPSDHPSSAPASAVVVEIPVPFLPSAAATATTTMTTATTVDELRGSVLALVAAAEGLVEDE
jgi:hypothetical protein